MVQQKHAFTLIELLVVVLIIGILAAIALPQYKIAVTKSKYATLKNLVKSIALAQENYYLANGKYSTDFESLDLSLPADKESSSTTKKYDYSWGYCHLNDASLIACGNSKIKMQFQNRYTHISLFPNQQTCIALSENLSDVNNKVCQIETGRNIPSGGGTGFSSYRYSTD
ncbi:MAG: prepilin-type N-terminal cleavage/methylation domain-containing protein [Elusimicrobiaceae bacterium]|nr:prepilin-type N-terminal cleavage/methylation domain-containing protein [Elusimicrobiaceae bacterium]